MTKENGVNGEEILLSTDITINNRTVTITGTSATGSQIKRTAIEQGVDIAEDFELAVRTEDGEYQIIVNDESVVLVDQKFIATAGDDNS